MTVFGSLRRLVARHRSDIRAWSSGRNLDHLQAELGRIEALDTQALMNVSRGMPYTGRADFTVAVAEAAMEVIKHQGAKPMAWAYATCSGAGKTVSMLQLKQGLGAEMEKRYHQAELADELEPRAKDLLRRIFNVSSAENPHPRILVAYTGFNSGLELVSEEKVYLCRGESGDAARAESLLARRLLWGAWFARTHPPPAGAGARHPRYDDYVVGWSEPPQAMATLEHLLQKLDVKPENPLVLIAGVDEVQLCDQVANIGPDSVALGRYFLRTLRGWQQRLFARGLVLVPLGTGVSVNFAELPTIGVNYSLSGGDQVLISRESFAELTKSLTRSGRPYPEGFKKRLNLPMQEEPGGPGLTENHVHRLVASLLWPRVRHLENLLVRNRYVPTIADANERAWGQWMKNYMLDAEITIKREDLLPGAGSPEIHVAFELTEDHRFFRVFPDYYAASSIVDNLKNLSHVDELEEFQKEERKRMMAVVQYLVAPNNTSFEACFSNKWQTFERLAFSVLSTHLVVGLEAARTLPEIFKKRHSATRVKRTRLVDYLFSTKAVKLWGKRMETPVVVQSGEENSTVPGEGNRPQKESMEFPEWPFQTATRETLHEDFLGQVKEAVDLGSTGRLIPIFMELGPVEYCRYFAFLYPRSSSSASNAKLGPREYSALFVGMRHIRIEKRPRRMEKSDAIPFLEDVVRTVNALNASADLGMKIVSGPHNGIFMLGNAPLGMASRPDDAAAARAAYQAARNKLGVPKRRTAGSEVVEEWPVVLDRDTFELQPWSDTLFCVIDEDANEPELLDSAL